MLSAQKLAIIGDPVAHSLSPKLHSFLIRHFALPFTYEALHIRRDELPEMVQRLRDNDFRGINITIPHKQAVWLFLDEIDATAGQIGAVNAIVVENGRLIGYNTDVLGFLRSFEAADIKIADEKAFVLGAGGAGRAVIFALLQARIGKIFLSNRSVERANTLITAFANPAAIDRLQIVPWSDRAAWIKKSDVNLVINTTSVGMHPHEDESPLPAAVFSSQMLAADLVYNPLQTAFLRAANLVGAKTINGLGMLIHQGIAALELWSRQRLDISDIYTNLEKELTTALKK
jgi:shikimate dehydrogenase